LDGQEVILAALAELRDLLKTRRITLEKDLSESAMIKADPQLLRRALREIINTALRSLEGVSSPRIYIRAEASQGVYRIRVEDNGCGIPTDQMSRVFTPHFSSGDEEEPAWSGLAVAYGAIVRMQGKVYIEPTTKEGTCLVLEVPLGKGATTTKSSKNQKQKPVLGHPDETEDDMEPEVITELKGQKPLSGSLVDNMPAAPRNDEVTLTGVDIDFEEFDKIDSEISGDEQELEEDVRFRAPKVKVDRG
jgi:anti-sigma regulatory factor (Ser/Thr protein kinase)